MKKIVVIDTNIIFSAMQKRSDKFRDFISNNEQFEFIAPNFLFVEIFKHKERLLKNATLDEDLIIEYLSLILTKIRFVNEEVIETSNFIAAYRLCKEVDENDTTFVALALEFNGLFWTKDEKLKNGLKQKGFHSFFEM
jgi:predicted nucleic acid-binding protein